MFEESGRVFFNRISLVYLFSDIESFHLATKPVYICTCPQFKSAAIIVLAAGANAFAPSASNGRFSTAVNFQYGKYDDQCWDHEAKMDVYATWDPSAPRSATNFNPFGKFKLEFCGFGF